jgi:uncharacterized membrane protein (DUF106 family)
MVTITAHTIDTAQIEAIKAMLNAFKIQFEIGTEKPYNPEFLKKIEVSKKQVERGQVKRVKKEDINDFLGL